jgi:hypothetical protein
MSLDLKIFRDDIYLVKTKLFIVKFLLFFERNFKK